VVLWPETDEAGVVFWYVLQRSCVSDWEGEGGDGRDEIVRKLPWLRLIQDRSYTMCRMASLCQIAFADRVEVQRECCRRYVSWNHNSDDDLRHTLSERLFAAKTAVPP